MPSYRSSDEAEVRDAVVKRLRALRPTHRIIHEIQNACQGPNRIDLISVGAAEIIAVEVKSKKDKLDRLPAQVAAMRGMAHHVIAAIHEKFLISPAYKNGPLNSKGSPPEARGAIVWAFPEAGAEAGRTWGCAAWQEPRQVVTQCLPWTALDMLWAEELRSLCTNLGVAATARSTRPQMIHALRWKCTGGDITKGICAALLRRECVEADPPIAHGFGLAGVL